MILANSMLHVGYTLVTLIRFSTIEASVSVKQKLCKDNEKYVDNITHQAVKKFTNMQIIIARVDKDKVIDTSRCKSFKCVHLFIYSFAYVRSRVLRDHTQK
jgi:hypothetical protein